MIYEQRHPDAFEQEKASNRAFLKYQATAKALANLIKEIGEEPKRNEPEYKAVQKAKAVKQEAFVAWQREAQRHGAMLIDLTPKSQVDPDANIPV